LTDAVQLSFDLIALTAFIAFTGLCVTLARSLKGSGLRRGFTFASIAGLVHLIGNFLTLLGDLALVGSAIPLLAFSLIQAAFAVLLALAVQSFFPAWYKSFRKDSGKMPGSPLS